MKAKYGSMFPFLIVLLGAACLFSTACAPKNWYVSAAGNDANKGTSESLPFKTLGKAIDAAAGNKGEGLTITIIGTLGIDSEGGGKAVFVINKTPEKGITITGKAAQQAVLDGSGAEETTVLLIDNKAELRLENITVSGAQASSGITVTGNSTLTLGKGVKVCNNNGAGIVIQESSKLIMEGGEISENGYRGVYADTDCIFTMIDGLIKGNTASSGWGGGVYIKGIFVMEGGEISENLTDDRGRGGGICIDEEASFTLKGGRIINNRSEGYSRRNGGVGNAGGGGVVINGCESGKTTFVMEGGEISGNTAERYGGGVLFITNQNETGTFTMTGGKITGNTAKGGGGLQNYGNRFDMTISGGEITGNTPDNSDNGWNW